MGDSAAYFLWLVVCVALVAALAVWFTRFAAGRGAFGAVRAGKQMEVRGQLPLGREQKLVLVQAGERCFLLGVTGASITNLAEFTAEDLSAWQDPGTPGAPAGFRDALEALRNKESKGR